MGRKPLSDVAKTDTTLRIRLTESERAELDSAATATGSPTSTWARDLLLTAARASTPVATPAKKRSTKGTKLKDS